MAHKYEYGRRTKEKMSSEARRTLDLLQRRVGLFNGVYTGLAFLVTVLLLPAFLILFLFISIYRYMWLSVLERLYPDFEFVNSTSVRTTVETPRNRGILTVLLQIKGSCDIRMFKSRIQRELLNRTKNGHLVFPHLRTSLKTIWGWYVWEKQSTEGFNLDNHVIVSQPVYNEVSMSDKNIQKFISDCVSKYINPDIPPWQLTIIPFTDKFYVLICLHHLYLSEEHIGLGDLLLLEPEQNPWCEDVDEYLDQENILAGTFKTPIAIPQVYQHISESFSNFWNELVSEYDPLENPKIHNSPTLKSFVLLVLITSVSAMKDYFRSDNPNWKVIIKNETQKRFLTKRLFWHSLLNTFHPVTAVKCLVHWSWWLAMLVLLHSVRTVLNIPVYMYWIVLSYHVLREILYLARIIFTGPRVILQELIFSRSQMKKHHLQTVSLCGRKGISWSKPVPIEYIQRIHELTGASGCEILLSATSASLRDYFRSLGFPVPNSVLTTSRFIPQELLLSGIPTSHHDGGFLCLNLPLNTADQPLETMAAVQSALHQARSSQASIYLASLYKLDHSLLPRLLPSALARILLYALSRRYSVTITQVDAMSIGRNRRRLLWGQEVENVMYWRPPQAQISLSITIMTYGDFVRLGVMADNQLSPQFSVISSNFYKHIGQMAVLCGVNRRSTIGVQPDR